MTNDVRIGLIGFGWMGQAHSRSYRNIPVYFPDSGIRPRLAMVADSVAERVDLAKGNFGFETGKTWLIVTTST
jgi:predicted dehydrogenase